MDPAALTRQIKAIEREGWIERHSDAKDNRLTNVALTAAGREVVGAALPRRTAFIERAFGDLSREQMGVLQSMLQTLEHGLQHASTDQPGTTDADDGA